MSNLTELGWAERFAVIDALEPTDEQIQTAFDIDADELATARELRDAGQFAEIDIDTLNIDLDALTAAFDVATATVEDVTTAATEEEEEPTVAPTTATAPVRTPKKRGRKGNKVALAFAAVPTTPVDVQAFAIEHNVSIHCLRQGARFDKTGLPGKVRVKKIDGVLSVYRDEATD